MVVSHVLYTMRIKQWEVASLTLCTVVQHICRRLNLSKLRANERSCDVFAIQAI